MASNEESPAALASISYRSERSHRGPPESWKFLMPYAAVTRYCKGTLLAVKLPPRTGNTITRLSPDLFSLMDATSNTGRGVAGWAKAWQEASARLAAAMARR